MPRGPHRWVPPAACGYVREMVPPVHLVPAAASQSESNGSPVYRAGYEVLLGRGLHRLAIPRDGPCHHLQRYTDPTSHLSCGRRSRAQVGQPCPESYCQRVRRLHHTEWSVCLLRTPPCG